MNHKRQAYVYQVQGDIFDRGLDKVLGLFGKERESGNQAAFSKGVDTTFGEHIRKSEGLLTECIKPAIYTLVPIIAVFVMSSFDTKATRQQLRSIQLLRAQPKSMNLRDRVDKVRIVRMPSVSDTERWSFGKMYSARL